MSWYLEKILPGEYGVPLPFYFPFTRSYWLPSTPRVGPSDINNHNVNRFAFEQEPLNLKQTVSIQNLSKVIIFKILKDLVRFKYNKKN